MQTLKVAAFAFALVCSTSLLNAQHSDHSADEPEETYTLGTAPFRASFTLECVFERECLEDEACVDTTFTADLRARTGGLTEEDTVVEAELSSVSGTTTVLGVRSNKAMSLAGGVFEARHLLTISASGAARYTLHLSDGPMVISYLGACL